MTSQYIIVFILFILMQTASVATARIWTLVPNSGAKAMYVVQKAANGDTIIFRKGVHRISNLEIFKTLTFLGEKGAVLDGEEKGYMMSVEGKDIQIQGLVFRNTGRSAVSDFAAIRANRCKGLTLKNNRFENTYFAVHLSIVYDSEISGNVIIGVPGQEMSTANGIHLWQCGGVKILNNHIENHRDGLYFEFAQNSFIQGNVCIGNFRYGLHFMFSNDNIYQSNTFARNGAGVAVMFSKRVSMRNNNFLKNRGGSAYGILLKEISDCKIVRNLFEDNTTALYLDGCNRVAIDSNRFVANGWGVRLMSNCLENNFYYNIFNRNTFDVSTNGSVMENRIEKNYWDKYQGYDLNRNGIGDVPFRPSSLFTTLAENIPTTMLLNRSLIAQLLDQAERAVPALTPRALEDSQPLIHMPVF
jgi:nitrous oxidase accessory protein